MRARLPGEQRAHALWVLSTISVEGELAIQMPRMLANVRPLPEHREAQASHNCGHPETKPRGFRDSSVREQDSFPVSPRPFARFRSFPGITWDGLVSSCCSKLRIRSGGDDDVAVLNRCFCALSFDG
jgi:hypothetical protein